MTERGIINVLDSLQFNNSKISGSFAAPINGRGFAHMNPGPPTARFTFRDKNRISLSTTISKPQMIDVVSRRTHLLGGISRRGLVVECWLYIHSDINDYYLYFVVPFNESTFTVYFTHKYNEKDKDHIDRVGTLFSRSKPIFILDVLKRGVVI